MIPRDELLRVKRIAGKANPRVKDWTSLAARKGRDALSLTLADGAKLAAEGLAAGGGWLRPETLLIADMAAERPEAGDLFRRAGEMGVERVSVSDDCYDKISGLKNGDGFALVLRIADDVDAVERVWTTSGERWLVAAEVQDPGNAGALARTALAAGFDGCLFVGGADPLSPKFLRGSMGAAFRLPCLGLTPPEFDQLWARHGEVRMLVATAGDDAADYRQADYSPPLALVVGGERGVPVHIAGLPHETAHIPLAGGVESLNLAVAAGIMLFEAARR